MAKKTIRIEMIQKGDRGAKVSQADVILELERLSPIMGVNLTKFIDTETEPGKRYFEAPVGAFSPELFPHVNYDSPEIFAFFFLLTTSYPFAAHQQTGSEFAWKCWKDKVNPILEYSRGFGKTILVRSLVAYLMGVFPYESSLIIRQASQPAQQSAQEIAKIISENPAWDLFFDYLEPKRTPGQSGGEWSAQAGYSIEDTRLTPQQQATKEASRTSPSLSRYGVGQSAAIGTGVTLIMATDDIHSDENSKSPTQLDSLIRNFQDELQPTVRPGGRQIIIGTRWSDDDLLSVMPETGQWRKLVIPITVNGEYPGEPMWPQMFDADEIERLYESDITPNKRNFTKNRLLKIVADFATHFTWLDTPLNDFKSLKEEMENRIGVDYASASKDPLGAASRSHTAMIVISRNPVTMRWIVTEVLVGQYTQSQSENHLKALWARNLPCPAVVIEESGTGIEMVALMERHKGMPIIGLVQAGHGSKETRWERDLEPILANGYLTISDEKTPGLDALRSALGRYPSFRIRGDQGADLLDALWVACYYPMIHAMDPFAPKRYAEDEQENPFYAFGSPPGGEI